MTVADILLETRANPSFLVGNGDHRVLIDLFSKWNRTIFKAVFQAGFPSETDANIFGFPWKTV